MADEQGFLKAILERPDDDARKLVYADWLDEQGDPRAEYLRLMMKQRRERVITPKQRQRHQQLSAELATLLSQGTRRTPTSGGFPRHTEEEMRRVRELEGELRKLSRKIRQPIPARLQELAATLDPHWLAIVSDPQIELCGKSGGARVGLHFEFVCDQSWADMRPTDDNAVRHCEACSKNVHYCDTIVDARTHARRGECIAVDLGIIRRDGDLEPRRMMMLGRVSAEEALRMNEEDIDPVSQARLDARKSAESKQ